MTYSIVARDARTGQVGVAVQSHWFSVGTVVSWVEAGIGAVATQAFCEPAYGPQGLGLMNLGLDAPTALSALITADPGRDRRQVALIDAQGGVSAHTGAGCIAAAGHLTGDAVSVQANMMRSDAVWPAMLQAYRAAEGELADRLMAALDAAEAAGGDVRGRQSAAMLIAGETSSGQSWRDRVVDLRVDDSPDPLGELRRLLTVHRGYRRMEAAEERQVAGDLDGALQEYQAARPLLAGNDEATFWASVLLADSGRADEARPMFREIVAREPGWAELLRRLAPSQSGRWSFLRDGDAAVLRLLDSG